MDSRHSSTAPTPASIRRGGGELPPPSYEVAAKYSPKVRAHRAGSELEHSSRQSTPVSATAGGFPQVVGSDEYPHTTTAMTDNHNDLRPRTNSNMKISFAPGTNGAVMGKSAGGGSAGGGDVSLSEVTDLLDNDDWLSQSNNGGGGGGESVENLNSDHYTRLIRFYERYNPEKIERAYEFLKAYKGDEEELFRLLTEKYGPEPERPKPPPDADGKGSEAGSMFHFVGPRVKLPERVSPIDGRTEMITPYWPAFRTLGDRDILDLLLSKRTDNKELKKCYIGFLDGHPQHAWNGMTYLSAAPLPKDPHTLFLGHTWSGTLANNKTLIYRTGTFRRVVLHCTDDCQARELPKVRPKQPVPTPTPTPSSTTAPLPLPSDSRGSTTVDEGSPMSSVGSSGGVLTQRTTNHSRQPSFDPISAPAKPSDYVIAPSPHGGDSAPFSLDGNSSAPPSSENRSPHLHGRWRLAIYHSDHLEHVLYRVMYDPDLVAMMWDGGNSGGGVVDAGGGGGMGQAASSKGSHTDPASPSLLADPSSPTGGVGGGMGRKHGSSLTTDPRSASLTDAPGEKRSFFSSLFSKKKKEDMLSESEGRAGGGVGGAGPTTHPTIRGGRPSSSTRPTSAPRDDDQYSISTGSSIRPRGASPNRPYSRSGVRVLGYTEPQQPVRQPSPMPRPPQLQQPPPTLPPPNSHNATSTGATLAQFTQLLNGLESRMVVRLDALEARLTSLESRLQNSS